MAPDIASAKESSHRRNARFSTRCNSALDGSPFRSISCASNGFWGSLSKSRRSAKQTGDCSQPRLLNRLWPVGLSVTHLKSSSHVSLHLWTVGANVQDRRIGVPAGGRGGILRQDASQRPRSGSSHLMPRRTGGRPKSWRCGRGNWRMGAAKRDGPAPPSWLFARPGDGSADGFAECDSLAGTCLRRGVWSPNSAVERSTLSRWHSTRFWFAEPRNSPSLGLDIR